MKLWCLIIGLGCSAESPWASGHDATVAIATAWGEGDCQRVVTLAVGYEAETDLRLQTVSTWYATCLGRLGQSGQAEAVFTSVLESKPGPALRTLASYRRGRLRYDQRSWQTAGADFAVASATTTSVWYDNALYYEARCSYRQATEGATAPLGEALAGFEDLLERAPESPYADNAAYFRGRSLERLGLATDAEAAYAAFLPAYPASAYLDDAAYRLTLLRLGRSDCEGAKAAAAVIPATSARRAETQVPCVAVCGMPCA